MNIPTRPGWWWRQGNHGPYIEEVDGDQNHALYVSLSGTDVEDDGSWLAEVPAPDVCLAVAECEAAEAAWSADEPETDEISESLERAVIDAEARLYAALRTARKGQEVNDG